MHSYAQSGFYTADPRQKFSPISGHVADRLLRALLEQAARCVVPAGQTVSLDPTYSLDSEGWAPATHPPHARGRALAVHVRHVEMYLCHVVLKVNFKEVGRVFSRSRTTAAYACKAIEDARDDRTFDQTLQLLEAATRLAVARTNWTMEAERA
jgi:Bacterial dnaA protein helix-turn-helix